MPCLTAKMNTETVKNPSSRKRAQAPEIGIHLPTENDRIAESVPTQMKMMPKAKKAQVGSGLLLLKNVSHVAMASVASVPPNHTGFVIQ